MRLVILLHGVRASGADLADLEAGLRPHLPQASFLRPDAPFAHDDGAGRQWYSQTGISPQNRPARVRAARPAFDALLSALIARHGLTDDPGSVALVGYSQGAIMALDAVASGRWPVAAVVGLSGRLATASPLRPLPATALLLVHGAADGTIPPRFSLRAADRLAQAGAAVSLRLIPHVGHWIAPEATRAAGLFLASALPPRRPPDSSGD